jgi:rhodanese-related sulfurtransferase
MMVNGIKTLLSFFLIFFVQSSLASHGAESDVDIKEVMVGQGVEAKAYSAVEVHYTGKLESGTVFDSSIGKSQPFKFIVGTGQVIQGWDIGVRGMKAGGKRQLKIPPTLAYGSKGIDGVIPPNATLLFDIELITVTPPVFSSIDNNDLVLKLEKGIKLIDIRRPEEWRFTGVVEGSIKLTAFNNRGQFQKSFIGLLEKTVKPDEEFAVICQTGGRTAALSNWLASRGGYKNVLNIKDGIKSWIDEGRRVIKTE